MLTILHDVTAFCTEPDPRRHNEEFTSIGKIASFRLTSTRPKVELNSGRRNQKRQAGDKRLIISIGILFPNADLPYTVSLGGGSHLGIGQISKDYKGQFS